MTAQLVAIMQPLSHRARHRPAGIGRLTLVPTGVLYALLAPLAFPILEMLLNGQNAVQFAVDVLSGQLPILAALRADWLKYGLTLWDPHLTSGNATMVQMPLPPFTPDLLLSFFVPLFNAYFLAYAMLIWVAGFGMHLFLRDSLGLGRPACIVGGAIYMFSFWPYIYGYAMPLLPFSLWLLDRWANATVHRWWLSLALIITGAFQLYTGLLQLTAVVGVLQLAYLVTTKWRSGRARRLAIEWFGIWAVSLSLFAPVAMTMLVYLPGSVRTIWNLQWLYPTAPLDALHQTASLFGSALGAIPVAGWTLGSAGYAGTFFIGGIALPFLYIGLFSPRDARLNFLLAMLAALPALYAVSLILMPLQAEISFLGSFQTTRLGSLFPFALATNAAIGAGSIFSGGWRVFFRGRLRAAGLGCLIVLLAAEAIVSLTNWAHLPDAGQAASGWLLAAIAIGVGTALGAILLWHTTTRAKTGAVVTGPLLAILLVGLVGESVMYARAERYLHEGLSTYTDYMTVDPGQAYILSHSGGDPDRILTVGFPANRALNAGLNDVGGLEPIYPLTYHELFGVLMGPQLDTNPAAWQYFNWWGESAFPSGPGLDYPVADLMGVRWIWTWGVTLHDPQLVLRFRSRAIAVYENAAAFPRAFVVNRVEYSASEAALLSRLAEADDAQLRGTAFAVQGEGIPDLASSGSSAPSEIMINRYSPDRVEVGVRASAPGLLILTDTYAPGWTATVCGSAAPIYRIDAAYRAVAVPSGTCMVTFDYRPVFTYAGFGLAGATFAALVGLSGLVLWSQCRSRAHDRPLLGDLKTALAGHAHGAANDASGTQDLPAGGRDPPK